MRSVGSQNQTESGSLSGVVAVWWTNFIYCLFFLPVALQALKKKKRYEKQLAQIDGTLSTIEFQREVLENANTNTEVLKNMSVAAKAMKAAHENM